MPRIDEYEKEEWTVFLVLSILSIFLEIIIVTNSY